MFVSRSTMKKIVVTTVLGVSLISSALAATTHIVIPNGPAAPTSYYDKTFSVFASNLSGDIHSIELGAISEDDKGRLVAVTYADIPESFLNYKAYKLTVVVTPGLSSAPKNLSEVETGLYENRSIFENLDVVNFNTEDGNWIHQN